MEKYRRTQRLMGEINVTPFVDVMLVLLIIFMVTAPLMQRGIDIQLPQEAAEKVDLSKGVVISIKKNKNIYLGKEIIPLSKLEKRLKYLYDNEKLREVYLKADRNLPYGFVVKAMAKIKRAGIQRLGMVTEFME